MITYDPVGEYDQDRPRRWRAQFLPGCVVVSHCAVLQPGEDLTENPPRHELTHDEWAAQHGQYDLDVDGQPLAATP